MRSNTNPFKLFLILFSALWLWVGESQSLQAATTVSCSQFMAPKKNVNGKMVGQEECLMQDHGIVDSDRLYHRVDMGITGTLSGWLVKAGARANHFTSAPDFMFTQFGNPDSPRFHGILRYEAAKGTSLTLVYPETGWNGKVFVLVHGSSGSFRRGTMKPWNQYFDSSNPMGETNDRYELTMLAKGYAIAKTRRNADRWVGGDYEAVLDDGTVWPDQNICVVSDLILDEVRLVDNFLKDRLGRKPTRNYWFGHSAGGYFGFALNYEISLDPKLNKDADGQDTISGFINDDPGGGMFVPVLMKDGRDILYRTPAEKATFIKTISIAHQLYPLFYSVDTPWSMDHQKIPAWVSPVALDNKRTTARMFKEKGMGNVFRMYEVRGVSHHGGEDLPTGKQGSVEILNLPRLMDGVIDILDNWVEKGIEPPSTRSDGPRLTSTNNAIDLPETTCPLGVYYPYPSMLGNDFIGVTRTGFAPFDGTSLEPMDGHVQTVDMNGNGQRDKRETMTEAWRRLGLLKAGETISRAKYVACVQSTVEKLQKEKFMSEKIGNLYLAEAAKKELPSQ